MRVLISLEVVGKRCEWSVYKAPSEESRERVIDKNDELFSVLRRRHVLQLARSNHRVLEYSRTFLSRVGGQNQWLPRRITE